MQPSTGVCSVLCAEAFMPTNLNLDDQLIAEAVRLGGHKTKREAVNAALKAYVRHLGQMEAVASFGTIEFDPAYDVIAIRRGRT